GRSCSRTAYLERVPLRLNHRAVQLDAPSSRKRGEISRCVNLTGTHSKFAFRGTIGSSGPVAAVGRTALFHGDKTCFTPLRPSIELARKTHSRCPPAPRT